MNETVKFYMVMRDDCNNYSKKRHATEREARVEAQRLCIKENARFFVMTFIAYVEPESPPVKWHENYIPF